MEQEDLRVMTESECLGGCEAHDELDSVDGSDEAILFEEDGADPFEPVEEAGLRGTLLDLHPEGARGDDSGSPTIGTSLHDVCRRAAAKLEIPWPNAPPEKTGSRYEGKRLPRVKSAERQLLPLFPECVEEATRTWSQPFSSKSPIQGGAALECVDMEERGLFKLPLVEPLVAQHLHPGQKALSTSSAPSFPSKTDGFQSSMTDKAYKSVALGVRALNASSMLMAYQAELQDEMSGSGVMDRKLWDEMCVVTDLCLRLHRCTVQASGRAMGTMVAQERARWLNLSSLSHREKVQLLDVAVDPKGLFGPAMTTMQRRCEEKKREGEALQTCMPRKTQPPPAPTSRPSFAQAAARPPPTYRIARRPGSNPRPPPQPKTEAGAAWANKPAAPVDQRGGKPAPLRPRPGKRPKQSA